MIQIQLRCNRAGLREGNAVRAEKNPDAEMERQEEITWAIETYYLLSLQKQHPLAVFLQNLELPFLLISSIFASLCNFLDVSLNFHTLT